MELMPRPSGLHTLVNCAMSLLANAMYPSESTEAAEYGSAAHWFSESLIKGDSVEVGDEAPNGVEIDHEIYQGCQDYISHCRNAMSTTRFHGIETGVVLSELYRGMKGTVDFWSYNETSYTLNVDDLKFGMVAVEAYENYQLIAYTLGLLLHLGFDALAFQHITVVMTIHQPRAYHPDGKTRSWTINADELRGYWNIISLACHKAMRDDRFASSGSHCGYCDARHSCEAHRRAAANCIDIIDRTPHFVDHDVSNLEQEYIELLRIKEVVSTRKSALEELLTETIKTGTSLSRLEISSGSTRREWSVPQSRLDAVEKIFKTPLTKQVSLSPAQAEKAGIPPSIVETLITKKPTKATLRKRQKRNVAFREFSNETN